MLKVPTYVCQLFGSVLRNVTEFWKEKKKLNKNGFHKNNNMRKHVLRCHYLLKSHGAFTVLYHYEHLEREPMDTHSRQGFVNLCSVAVNDNTKGFK